MKCNNVTYGRKARNANRRIPRCRQQKRTQRFWNSLDYCICELCDCSGGLRLLIGYNKGTKRGGRRGVGRETFSCIIIGNVCMKRDKQCTVEKLINIKWPFGAVNRNSNNNSEKFIEHIVKLFTEACLLCTCVLIILSYFCSFCSSLTRFNHYHCYNYRYSIIYTNLKILECKGG